MNNVSYLRWLQDLKDVYAEAIETEKLAVISLLGKDNERMQEIISRLHEIRRGLSKLDSECWKDIMARRTAKREICWNRLLFGS